MLEFTQELTNVSHTCKVMSCSIQQFYEIRRNYQTYGEEGLIDRLPGEIEAAVFAQERLSGPPSKFEVLHL